MPLKWTRIPDDDADYCASEECDGKPEWYAEAGGTGSYYCQDCKSLIDKFSAEGPPLSDEDIAEATAEIKGILSAQAQK